MRAKSERFLRWCSASDLHLLAAACVRCTRSRTSWISVALRKNAYFSLALPRMKFLEFSWSRTHTGLSTETLRASRMYRRSLRSRDLVKPSWPISSSWFLPLRRKVRLMVMRLPYSSGRAASEPSFTRVTWTHASPSQPSRTRSPILLPRCVDFADAPRQICSAARMADLPDPLAPLMKLMRRQGLIVSLRWHMNWLMEISWMRPASLLSLVSARPARRISRRSASSASRSSSSSSSDSSSGKGSCSSSSAAGAALMAAAGGAWSRSPRKPNLRTMPPPFASSSAAASMASSTRSFSGMGTWGSGNLGSAAPASARNMSSSAFLPSLES
mmetsp:Transcript_4091/g.12070  ORF Transcript_4091/g.12070 Transcript_4091/m.12070 type:complete len:329 (-) Transcript_4091:568-1554(-)